MENRSAWFSTGISCRPRPTVKKKRKLVGMEIDKIYGVLAMRIGVGVGMGRMNFKLCASDKTV